MVRTGSVRNLLSMESSLPRPISAATSRFAAFTLAVRFPFIINQLKAGNPLSSAQEVALDGLLQEIAEGVVPSSDEMFYPEERPYWEAFLVTQVGKRYQDVPFYEAG